jgi:CubicO group peptidase (beta-lactamase class C family)
MAASNTKAMTTLLLAEAVDAGKLRWDEKAVDAYPAFRLGDPDLTKRVEIHQLVCACTGIPRQDLEWFFGDPSLPAASVFDTLATMKPTSKFGEVFQYSNLMASAAGYIAASELEPGMEVGAAYDKAIGDDIFTPLGMTDSTFNFAKAQSGDFARPHSFDIDGGLHIASMAIDYKIDPARPAGGMWTTSHDLSRYVLMELAKGVTPDGKRLVSEANLLERRKPQIMLGEDTSYGMGLMVDRHLGVEIVHHGGDLIGYHSDMIWLPQFGIGAVILTNSDSGPYLRGPFLRKLLELVFDGKPEADEQVRVGSANFRASIKKAREQITFPADPVATAKLADRYSNPILGSFTVQRSQGHVRFSMLGYTSEEATLKNPDGTTTYVAVDPGLGGVALVQGEKDGKRVLILRDAQHEYVFTETPAR